MKVRTVLPSRSTSKLSRITQLLRSSTSSGAIVQTLLVRVFVLGLNLATGIIVARTLAPVGRGEQTAMSIWPMVICGLLTLGIPVALRYHGRRKTADPAMLFTTALWLALALGLLASAIGIVAMPFWLAKYPAHVVHFAQWAMLFAPQILVAAIFQAFLESQGDFTRSNQIYFSPPLSTLVALLVLAFLHRLTPSTAVLAYFGPSVFLTIWMGYRLRSRLRLRIPDFRSNVRLLISYGLRSYGTDILNTLSLQIDQTLVIGFLSASSLGVYTVALSVSRMLNIIANSFNTVLFPKASSLTQDEAVKLIVRSARIGLLASICAGTLFAIAVPIVLPLFYGKAFVPAVPLARILTVEVILQGTISTLGQAFMATNRPATVTFFQFAGLCVTVPLMFVLIPRLGLLGAALSLLTSTSIRFVLILAAYPYVLKTAVPNLIVTAADFAYLKARLRSAA